jgi:hypothetical protein
MKTAPYRTSDPGRSSLRPFRSAACAAWLLLAPTAALAVDYTYVKVGVPSQTGSSAMAMDSKGRVATTSLIRSFLFADNFFANHLEITNVNVATSTPGMVAQGLNDLGEVVGRFRTNGAPANQTRGFIRRAAGTFEPFDFPGVASTSISEINNRGGMVGETRSDLTSFGLIRGFALTNGRREFFPVLGGVRALLIGGSPENDVESKRQARVNRRSRFCAVGKSVNEPSLAASFCLEGSAIQAAHNADKLIQRERRFQPSHVQHSVRGADGRRQRRIHAFRFVKVALKSIDDRAVALACGIQLFIIVLRGSGGGREAREIETLLF